jgi:anaerobic ribonucleoside-triphosphate reductase activating protein
MNPDEKSLHIRLGHPLKSLKPTLTNGPGWRVSAWIQGCSIRCTKQCLNPHFLSSEGGYLAPVERLIETVVRIRKGSPNPVEGLTLLGGEPTDQLPAVIGLFEGLRAEGFSTMVYTGHYLTDLRDSGEPLVPRFLAATDLLVDGPFIAELYDDTLAWRGSSNQTIYCLSSCYQPEDLDKAFARQRKAYSITLRPDGTVDVSGLQNRAAAAQVERLLLRTSRKKNRRSNDV